MLSPCSCGGIPLFSSSDFISSSGIGEKTSFTSGSVTSDLGEKIQRKRIEREAEETTDAPIHRGCVTNRDILLLVEWKLDACWPKLLFELQ